MLFGDKFKQMRFGSLFSLEFLGAVTLYIMLFLLLPFFSDFPLNDDWAYARNVVDSIANGRYTVTGFELAWGYPQVLLGIVASKLFGFSFELLRIINVFFGVGVLWFCSRYLRMLNVSRIMHLLVLLTIIVFPPFFVLGLTFLTDMAFLFFWIGTCYFWEKAFREKSSGFILVGAVFCVLTIAQRQFGVFLVFGAGAVVIFDILCKRAIEKKWIVFCITLCFILLATILMYSFWKKVSPGYSPSMFVSVGTLRFSRNILNSIMYLAFMAIPVSFAIFSKKDVSSFFRIFSERRLSVKSVLLLSFFVAPLLYLGVKAVYGKFMPYLGNMLSQWGFFRPNEIMPGMREKIFEGGEGFAVLGITVVAFLLLFFVIAGSFQRGVFSARYNEVVQHIRARADFYRLGFFSILASSTYILYISFRGVLFDRYLLSFFVCFVIVFSALQQKESIRKYIVSFVFVLCMAVLNYCLVSDYFSWNHARWKAIRWIESSGVNVECIDGGYEWFGWRKREYRFFELNRKYAYVVAFSPLPGYSTLNSFSYKTFFPNKVQYIHVLKADESEDAFPWIYR